MSEPSHSPDAASTPAHEVGRPCPRKPDSVLLVTTGDFERGECGICGHGLLSLDAYMDRGGR